MPEVPVVPDDPVVLRAAGGTRRARRSGRSGAASRAGAAADALAVRTALAARAAVTAAAAVRGVGVVVGAGAARALGRGRRRRLPSKLRCSRPASGGADVAAGAAIAASHRRRTDLARQLARPAGGPWCWPGEAQACGTPAQLNRTLARRHKKDWSRCHARSPLPVGGLGGIGAAEAEGRERHAQAGASKRVLCSFIVGSLEKAPFERQRTGTSDSRLGRFRDPAYHMARPRTQPRRAPTTPIFGGMMLPGRPNSWTSGVGGGPSGGLRSRRGHEREGVEVPPGFEPGNEGFADPCLTTWPRHRTQLRTL